MVAMGREAGAIALRLESCQQERSLGMHCSRGRRRQGGGGICKADEVNYILTIGSGPSEGFASHETPFSERFRYTGLHLHSILAN